MSPMPRRELRAITALAIILAASLLVMALARKQSHTIPVADIPTTVTDTVTSVKIKRSVKKTKKKSPRRGKSHDNRISPGQRNSSSGASPLSDRPSPLDQPLPLLGD